MERPMGYYSEFKPSLWQRFKWSSRWPWSPKRHRAEHREWGTQPWLVEVREDHVTIGWSPVDSGETTTVIVVGRWSALRALFGFSHLEFEVRCGADLAYRKPTAVGS